MMAQDKEIRVIRVTTEGYIELDTFTLGDKYMFEKLAELIGNDCNLVQEIPVRPGLRPVLPENIVVICDEEGLLKENTVNQLGAHIYGVTYPLMGDIIFMAEAYTEDGIDWVGLDDEDFAQMVIWIRKTEYAHPHINLVWCESILDKAEAV